MTMSPNIRQANFISIVRKQTELFKIVRKIYGFYSHQVNHSQNNEKILPSKIFLQEVEMFT